jgi:hypothetical protein
MRTTEYAEYTEMKKGLLMTIILFQTSVCSACSVVLFSGGERGIGFNSEKARKAAKYERHEEPACDLFLFFCLQISRLFAPLRGLFFSPKNCSALFAG